MITSSPIETNTNNKGIKSNKIIGGVIFAILLITAFGVARELSIWIMYEAQGPYALDSSLFFGVGRGILNGLIPYLDLWESKPPGIFLLSALSFWLTDDITIGSYAQALVIVGIPVALSVFALYATRGNRPSIRCSIVLLAFIIGGYLGLYTEWRAGQFQTESFGAFFAVLYIVLIARHAHAMGRIRTIAASLCIMLSLGFREPFLLSICAGTMLLTNNIREFVRAFIIPLIIAALIGITTLAALGYLGPYVDIYLPEMLFGRIQGNVIDHHGPFEPLWRRGFGFEWLFQDLGKYNTYLNSIITMMIVVYLVAIKTIKQNTSHVYHAIAIIFAAYLLTLSVGVGGTWWNHHYVFAIPGYTALTVVFLIYLNHHWNLSTAKTLFSIVVFFCFAAIFNFPYLNIKADIAYKTNTKNDMKIIADNIDNILDACGFDRYLFIGSYTLQPYAYTDHSPLGPLFFQYDHWMDEDNALFREGFIRNLHNAQLVVFYAYEMDAELRQKVETYISENFSTDPWPCARPYHPPHRWYTYYYRKNINTDVLYINP